MQPDGAVHKKGSKVLLTKTMTLTASVNEPLSVCV